MSKRPRNLGRSGLSMATVRASLGCSQAELRRWIDDRRLSPDGQRFYYGVGPHGGSRWHCAWLSETIENARARIDEWRASDALESKRYSYSETSLFQLVNSRFRDAVRQWSQVWLGRLVVDVYVPSLNVAFEYQGQQHFSPISAFGGDEGFRATQDRDARKRELLANHGVLLVEWRFDTPISESELDRALVLVARTSSSKR